MPLDSPSRDTVSGAGAPVGVLLVNLGSPQAPTARALRRYLAEFLWDPRVVEFPRAAWWLILHLLILRIRPARSARHYARVWTGEGSPLIAISRRQRDALDRALGRTSPGRLRVELAMRYGEPSIRSGLERLRGAGVSRLLVLPLYPQYSATTTASVFDAVAAELGRWRDLPELRFVRDYAEEPSYLQAMVARIRGHWKEHGRGERLLFSFHGIPRRYSELGDPYPARCVVTALRLAAALGLSDGQWQLVYQSRFGREEWLKPYADKTLAALAAGGVKSVDVFCPGFSADCLETLEEIDMENREVFMTAGGEHFGYVPALNDTTEHIAMMCDLVERHAGGWLARTPQAPGNVIA